MYVSVWCIRRSRVASADEAGISRRNAELCFVDKPSSFANRLNRISSQSLRLLALRKSESNRVEAETCFERATEVARQQSARWWELRATVSLARLLASQGRREEARARLAEIYNWFTEGFDTADLKDAKALLDELAT